jgi:hydroxymethylpyrimidine pyrophosphatase-like HAD family hydrolase/adenine/guanine phosphoribosyltransferase-like PRPP-binding protein
LIEERSAEWVDLVRYGWAKDLLLGLGSIRDHALAEADAAREPRTEGAPDALLNLLLLLCAGEQITADHLAQGGLDLSPVRRAVHTRALIVALSAFEVLAEQLTSTRATLLESDVARALGRTRSLALLVAGAIAQGATSVRVDPSELERCFPASRPELTRRRLKIPSCFRAQDITPADCFELARRFALEARPGSSALVVGIRTSGSYMAPLVAGWLRANGFDVRYTTVRPKSPLVGAEKRVIRRLRADAVLIVDDPPMTGASYVRTARLLEACGFAPSSITFLVPVGAESDARMLGSVFNRYARIELPHRELEVREQLESPELLSFIAAAAGRPLARVTALWPPGVVERQARRRHVKQVYDVQGDARVHLKGVGVGWLGYPARHIAGALSGRIPETLGFWGSLMATREAPSASPAGPAPGEAATYVSARARNLRVSGRPRADEFQKDGFYRLAKVLARVHGPLAPLRMARLRREIVQALGETPGCLVDGRMGREEWLAGSLKRDFEEHAFDKDDLGIYDAAYDLAGALLEFGPSRAAEERAVSQYIALTGDSGIRLRLSTAFLLYGVFLMERRSWEVEGERGTSAWSCAVQDWLEAEASLTWSVDRLLGDAFHTPTAARAKTLWSLDVDGVLEDTGLGFPSVTPAAAAALRRAHEAGALVLLNSGRSLQELVFRCDALRLDGAVAEYGSAIWDRSSGRSESLLDDDERQALEEVRLAARRLPDVHVDTRYGSSVRARRYVGGKLQSLDTDQVASLLHAGSGRVRAIVGVRQTDFISVPRNKGQGLQRLCDRLGFRGRVFSLGDTESDLPVAVWATRAYAPRHRDDSLTGAAIHLRHGRQRAVLDAVHREHGPVSARPRPDLPAADRALVDLLALRDASRAVRLLRAFGPDLLQVFRT